MAGRKSLGLKNVLVGLPEDIVGQIDAAAGSGQRSAWIRRAVEAALDVQAGRIPPVPMDGAPVVQKVASVEKPKPAPRPPQATKAIAQRVPDPRYAPLVEKVRAVLKTGGRSHRALEFETGLTGTAVNRAIRELGGEVHYPQPGIVALL